jgi:hypothetical protein
MATTTATTATAYGVWTAGKYMAADVWQGVRVMAGDTLYYGLGALALFCVYFFVSNVFQRKK